VGQPPLPGEDKDDRASGMRIDFTLSIGYERRRPNTQGDRLEARMDTVGLLVVGSIVTIIVLIIIVPRIFALFFG
jgi:hypothetical protein